MNIAGNSVGIDYHDKFLQVNVLEPGGKLLGKRKCNNEVEEVMAYIKGLGSVQSVALEACNGAANFADELHQKSGWHVKLCHPGYVQRMRHNPDKTDMSDSMLIGDLNRVGYLPEVWLAPESLRDLRTLIRYRQQKVNERKQRKLRIRSLLRLHRIKKGFAAKGMWGKEGMVWLNQLNELPEHAMWVLKEHLQALGEIEKKISETLKRIKVCFGSDNLIKYLMSIKGLGLITACLFRAEIGTFTRFRTGKQLSRFCGVTPKNASSGEKQADAGIIKAGNPLLKTALIQISHILIRSDEWASNLAKRLSKKGKLGCVVIAAVANRWLRRLFYQVNQFERTGCVN